MNSKTKSRLFQKRLVVNNCITAEVLNHAARLLVCQFQRLYCASQPTTANAHCENRTKKNQNQNRYRSEESASSQFVAVTEKRNKPEVFLFGQSDGTAFFETLSFSLKLFPLQLALTLACHHPDTNVFPTYISGLSKSSTVTVCKILAPGVCDHLQQNLDQALEVKSL